MPFRTFVRPSRIFVRSVRVSAVDLGCCVVVAVAAISSSNPLGGSCPDVLICKDVRVYQPEQVFVPRGGGLVTACPTYRLAAKGGLAVLASQSSGRSSSVTVGSAAGSRQTSFSRSTPARSTTVSQNAFPSLYWRSLSSNPSSLPITSPSPPRLALRASRRSRSLP